MIKEIVMANPVAALEFSFIGLCVTFGLMVIWAIVAILDMRFDFL
jgi:hypothetical protein